MTAVPFPGRRRRTFHVARGYYVVCDDGSDAEPLPDRIPPGRSVHPGRAATGGAMITTGTMTGPVVVDMEVLDDAPDGADDDGWDEVEEHTLVALGERILVVESEGEDRGFDVLEVEPGQRYRLRVSVRGRAEGARYPVGPDVPVESHLVRMWPEPPEG